MPNFVAFRPDAGELLSSTVSNVLMKSSGYGPRPSLQTAPGAAALAAAPRGAFGAFLPSGTFKGFGATSAEVYLLGATYGWTALSASLTLPADEEQAFTQFGVFMLTSNYSNGVKAYNMDTPAGLNAVSGAPAARWLFTANNQVIALGNGASALNQLSVSAFGDHTNWTGKGKSKQLMNDGGAFTGGGDLGNGIAVLLQLRAVRKMTFGNAGGGALFRLDKLADDVGCVHPRAQATYNGTTLFLHTDGWWTTSGDRPVNIGAGKINDWFLARVSDLKKVWVTVDPKNTVFRIRYAASGDGSTATVYNSILDYNWVTNEFIPGTEATSALFRMGTPGYTLDTISAAFGVLDNWSQFPLDSAFWQGGNFRLAGLDSTFKVGFFDGVAALAAEETPTETDGRQHLVNRLRVLTDDPSATVQVGYKDDLSDQMLWTDASVKVGKRYPVRARGVYRRYRVNHAAAATWSRDTGVFDVDEAVGAGR